MTDSSITELERRVTDLLQHDAEVAMSSADTETRYDDVVASAELSLRHRRIASSLGAVAVAVAVVIVLLLGGVPGVHSNKAVDQLPARDRTPVRIATDFVDALAAYDAAKAAHDVGVREDHLFIWPGEPSLREGLAWAEAARFTIMPKDCIGGNGPIETTVKCYFEWRFLASDHRGGGEISVRVRDGRIEGAETSMDWHWAGLRRDAGTDLPMWPSFVSWLERAHPGDVPAMIVHDGPTPTFQTPAYTDESVALWDRYVDEWVASHQ